MKKILFLELIAVIFLFVSCTSMASVYDGAAGKEKQYVPEKKFEDPVEIIIPEDPGDLDLESGKRGLIVAEAKKMLGRDYSYGSRDEDGGFDCSGLVQHSYEKAGIYLPRSSRKQYEKAEKIPVEEAKTADLIFFSTKGSGPSHVAIYLGDGKFIHSPSSGKQIRIDPLDNSYWSANFVGAGRYIKD